MIAAQDKVKSTDTKDTIEKIDHEIQGLQARLGQIQGTRAEVYSRIVGYYRSVKNWNAGKREEYGERKMFDIGSRPHGNVSEAAGQRGAGEASGRGAETVSDSVTVSRAAADRVTRSVPHGRSSQILLFTRMTCPNCPPVKKALASHTEFQEVDADTQEGRAQAVRWEIYATPTALVLDEKGKEVARLRSVPEINTFFAASDGRQVSADARVR